MKPGGLPQSKRNLFGHVGNSFAFCLKMPQMPGFAPGIPRHLSDGLCRG